MKLVNYLFVLLLIFAVACGGGETEQVQDESEAPESETTEAEMEEMTSTEENEEEEMAEEENLDFMLGSWKVVRYESEGTADYMLEVTGDDMGFYMERDVWMTSYVEFIIDGSYRVFNVGDYGDEDGNVEKGNYSVGDGRKRLTFNDGYGDTEWEIVELGFNSIKLQRQNEVDIEEESKSFPLYMDLEPMGE